MQKIIFSNIPSDVVWRKIIMRAEEQISRDIGMEAVILNLANSKYYGLNEVGARIWKIIEKPVSVKEICTILVDEFDVTPERCEKELLALLQEMADHQLIDLKNETHP
jgi:hypothetical protein